MLKNKSYIGISFIILIFGIYAIPKIVEKIKNDKIVQHRHCGKKSNFLSSRCEVKAHHHDKTDINSSQHQK